MLTNLSKKVTITPLGLDITSDLTFEEWSGLATDIGETLKSMSFVIGDWLVYGEEKFAPQPDLPGINLEINPRRIRVSSDRYEATQAATGLDPATLKAYAYVSRRVPRLLRNNLSVENWRPQTAGAFDFERWAKEKGLQVLKKTALAKAGDLVVFEFSHIGIIVKDQISADSIETIEGNTNGTGQRDSNASDGVWRKRRAASLVRSYIRLIR